MRFGTAGRGERKAQPLRATGAPLAEAAFLAERCATLGRYPRYIGAGRQPRRLLNAAAYRRDVGLRRAAQRSAGRPACGSTNEIAAVDYGLLGKKIAEVITRAGTHPHSKRASQRRALNRHRDRA